MASALLSGVSAASICIALATPGLAQEAFPTGGMVVAGDASIGAPIANSLTITQSSAKAVVNWDGFSIGTGNSVSFQNGSGATLNRVTGGNVSSLDGVLSATGSVYLVNPNGIIVGQNGVVDVGGSFVAATHDVDNSQFLNGGDLEFSGNSKASLINLGTINAQQGDVALIARQVTNEGTITAPNGTAGLAAGYDVLLTDGSTGNGKLQVKIGGSDTSVTNSGTIEAAEAELRTNGGNIYALAGNKGGTINATGVANKGGRVFLTAGSGKVATAPGTKIRARKPIVVANAPTPTPAPSFRGGEVHISVGDVTLGGTIDASGANGGEGGTVVAIADGTMSVGGTIRTGGAGGGFIETSGHTLDIGAASIDAGTGGAWLIDPYDLTIDLTAATTLNTALGAGTNVSLQTTDSGASGPGTANASGNGDIFINSALGWSSAALLTLDAYRSININAPITVSGNGGLALHYNNGGTGGNYAVNAPVNLSSSSTFSTQDGANAAVNYTVLTSLGAAGSETATDLQGINGDLTDHYVLGSNLDASSTSGWPRGFTPLGGNTHGGFTGTLDGLGHTISGLTINTSFPTANPQVGFFGAIDPGGLVQNLGLEGGSVSSTNYYTAQLFGADLQVGGIAGYNAGTLINVYTTANLTASNTFLPSSTAVGGLVGSNSGFIANSHATGNVYGRSSSAGYSSTVNTYVGGLVGNSSGNSYITNSYATGRVVSDAYSPGTIHYLGAFAGGLVGVVGESTTVSQSFATGDVLASVNNDNKRVLFEGRVEAYAGGLSGMAGDYSAISDTYASGNVQSNATTSSGIGAYSNAGGAIGESGRLGSLNNSYATGSVSGSAAALAFGDLNFGGLIGKDPYDHSYAVNNSFYADTIGYGGEGTSKTTAELKDPFTFIDAGWDFANVWGKSTTGENNGLMMLREVGPGTLYDAYVKMGSDTTKTYGDANPSLSGIAQVYGNATVDWGNAITPTTNVGNYAYSDANVLDINTSSPNGAYIVPGCGLTINPAALTVTANSLTKTYDGLAFGDNGATYTGFVNGDTSSVLGGALAYGGTAAGAVDVGNYAITPSGLTSGNYAINYVDGALTVNKAALTVTANNDTKTYDRMAYSGGNGATYSGFMNGETSSVLGGSLSYGGAAQGAVNAGTYGLSASGLTSGNYDISYVDGSLSVNKAALTVNASNASKTYGGDIASLSGYSVSGLLAGDSLTALDLISLGTSATANVGTYAINATNLVGTGLDNYNLTTNGALTVDPRFIELKGDDTSRVYGAANPNFSWHVVSGNLVNGDSLSGDLATTATTMSGVGAYTITQGTLTDANNPNYNISFMQGALNVTKAPLTVTANNDAKTYDGLAYSGGNGVTFDGFVNSDDGAVIWGLPSYGGSAQTAVNAGSYTITASGLSADNYDITYKPGTLTVNKAVLTVTANNDSRTYDGTAYSGGNGVSYAGFAPGDNSAVVDAGKLGYGGTAQQAINAGSYTITANGLSADNYSFNYVSGTLSMAPRDITVMADARTKVYGETDPVLTFSVGGLGLASGDGLSSVFTGALIRATGDTVAGGPYAISQGSLAANSDYNLTGFSGDFLTITPAPLTITANDKAKAVDGMPFAGPYTVSVRGLVNGDGVSSLGTITVSGSALAAIDAGNYLITPGGAANDNYAITFVDGHLVLTYPTPQPAPFDYSSGNLDTENALGGIGILGGTGGEDTGDNETIVTNAIAASTCDGQSASTACTNDPHPLNWVPDQRIVFSPN